ncbi:MAG: MBL fold metallo-hydrolase [Blautia marasmi]
MGIRKIDAIFLSHMDDDHINGIGELLKAIRNRETTLRIEKLFYQSAMTNRRSVK